MKCFFDWDKVKQDIDIEQFFLFKMGHLYSYDKSKKAYVEKNENGYGDIIRFFTHSQKGIKMYHSFVYQDSGDIIQLIKNKILQNPNANAEEINAEIFSFQGNNDYQPKIIQKVKNDNHNSLINRGDFEIYGDIIQKINLHTQYLTDYRGLAKETIFSEKFSEVLFHYRIKNIDYLGFYLKDIDGKIVGVNKIQTLENQYFNIKTFDKNSNNSVGFTFSNKKDTTETLSIFESIFDAMSFDEIYQPQNIQYISSNGELGFKKARLLHRYFENNGFKKLILGNDNDLAGHNFNLNIIATFVKSISNISRTKDYISIIIDTDNKEISKIKILLNFFKKSDKKYDIESGMDIPQSYFTETLSQNKERYFLTIRNNQNAIKFFMDLLMRIWNLDTFIQIKIPKNKDFNEDLKQMKNNGKER